MTPNVYAKGIKADFARWMDAIAAPEFNQFIVNVQSRNASEEYMVAGSLPSFEILKDEINFSEISDKALTITNYDYAAGVREDRNLIEDSQEYLGGFVETRLKQVVVDAKNLPARLIHANLMRSTSATAFDGLAFWSTSRTLFGSTTLINVYDTTGLDTLAEIEAAYAKAKEYLLSMKDKNDNPFNLMSEGALGVLVPYNRVDLFRQLLGTNQSLLASTGTLKSNVWAGDAKIMVNYFCTSTQTDFYLMNLNRADAFIWQTRKAPAFDMKDDTTKKWVEYYWKARYGYGYGMPTSIVRVMP